MPKKGHSSLARQRTAARRLLTEAAKAFQAAAGDPSTYSRSDIHAFYLKVQDRSRTLNKLDEQLLQEVHEDLVDEELVEVTKYRDVLCDCEAIYTSLPKDGVKNSNTSSSHTTQLHFPKLQLKCFDLHPGNWMTFWSNFQLIHDDAAVPNESKFQYLMQMLEPQSKAAHLTQPFSANSYDDAISMLKNRFGREELIIQTHVNNLLRLVLDNKQKDLSTLYDEIHGNVRALESLGVASEKYGLMLCPLVEGALPIELLKQWERHKNDRESKTGSNLSLASADRPSLLNDLMDFLETEVRGEERAGLVNRFVSQQSLPTAAALVSTTNTDKLRSDRLRQEECSFCDKTHPSERCFKALKLTLAERRALLSEKKACTRCGQKNHNGNQCRSKITCFICGKQHLAILCSSQGSPKADDSAQKQSRRSDTPKGPKKPDPRPEPVCVSTTKGPSRVYLQTLLCTAKNKHRAQQVRILLDSASENSYVTEKLAKALQYKPTGTINLSHGLFGGVVTPVTSYNTYRVNLSPLHNTNSFSFDVTGKEALCAPVPPVTDSTLLSELREKGVTLSDIQTDSSEIDIILGAKDMASLLTANTVSTCAGSLAVETLLGWTLLGGRNEHYSQTNVSLALLTLDSLPSLWELGTLGIQDPVADKCQSEVLADIYQSIAVNEEGRYEVRLPWKEHTPPLGDNRQQALIRLERTTQKLRKDNLYGPYDEVLDSWQADGITEVVTDHEPSNAHYLPHRPVIKASSETTKLRPVFDASCNTIGPRDKESGLSVSTSLNSCLEPGPNLITLIPDILTRFRCGRIGVSSDIAKAFLNISVSAEDRDLLRFLWYNKDGQLEERRHCRLVFGLTCSPCILAAVITRHLASELQNFPDTVTKLCSSFYVDNSLTAVNTLEEYDNFQKEAVTVMSRGQFKLTQWHRNKLPDNDQKPMGVTNALGLVWDLDHDSLTCKVPTVNDKSPTTKRTLLAVVNSIFDVLGFWCPVTVQPKTLLQVTWKRNLSWDEELPEDLLKVFNTWAQFLPILQQCSIPRHLHLTKGPDDQIHVFCDSSGVAYAACIFLRTVVNSEVKVELIQARNRIAPLEKTSIPRLELMAALIAARLFASVKKTLSLPEDTKVNFWSDSQVTLTWIKSPGPWNVFVNNRVKEIHSLTATEDWRFVPGSMNPADLPSRGCHAQQLLTSQWWSGPQWLYLPESEWPPTPEGHPQLADEERKLKPVAALIALTEESDPLGLARYFSDYRKIVRMLSYIFRMQHRAKGPLTSEEIVRAEKFLWRYVQLHCSVAKNLRGLHATEGADGLLRVKTRLIDGLEPPEFQSPILLPGNHKIVSRLIEWEHKTHMHASVRQLTSILRQRFWILGLRVIRTVVHRCVRCRKFQAKHAEVAHAPLPNERTHADVVFQHIGMDLCGPLFLNNGSKVWIVLITCATYRLVHFELVDSLSTEALMLAIRRFLARRGRAVETIFCDNGSNLVGANNTLSAIDWEKLENDLACRRIVWKHQPPLASWWGGFFERVVSMLKSVLRRCLGTASLSYVELESVLCEAEACVNARPLTGLTSSPSEPQAISPDFFLHGAPYNVSDFDEADATGLNRRARHVNFIRESLRRRFRDEYVALLAQRGERKVKPVRPGDVVLIGDDEKRRVLWPLGLVLETFPGKDGHHRVALVRTHGTILRRPLQRLYPLEVSAVAPEFTEIASDNEVPSTPEATLTPSVDSKVQPAPTRAEGKRQVRPPVKLDL